MVEPFENGVQVGLEGDRRSEAQHIALTTGLIRQLGEETLSPSGAPESVSRVADTGAVDGVNNDSRFLGRLNSGIDVLVIGRKSTSQSLNAAADHDHLPPRRVGDRPFF